jgi:probable HAF family extracellular repeat protein
MHAFVYSNGTITDLGTFGGVYSEARGINSTSQIVGNYVTANGETRAFLRSKGGTTDITSGNFTYARAINDLGQVVGDAASYNGFVYENETMTNLGITTGTNVEVYGINAHRQIVGGDPYAVNGHAFLYDNGVTTDLGSIGGFTKSSANAINDSGQVAGSADGHAFLYDHGTFAIAGTFGGQESIAQGINNNGQVVGIADTTSGDSHAFLYRNGMMTDLNSLIDPTSGWALTDARAINDSGWIVGSGLHNGDNHAFLMMPVPEPPAIYLLATGILGFVVCARQRLRVFVDIQRHQGRQDNFST